MIRAVGINSKQNNQDNNILFFIWEAGRLEEYQKGVMGFNEKKKGEKFWSAVSTGLRPKLTASHNFSPLFYLFLFVICRSCTSK